MQVIIVIISMLVTTTINNESSITPSINSITTSNNKLSLAIPMHPVSSIEVAESN